MLSGGDYNYERGFLRLDTGEFGPWGTKAFIAGSYQNYDKFKGPGELEKKQVNAVIRQDFENENFISVGVPLQRESQRVLSHRQPGQLRRCTAATTTTSTSCTRDCPDRRRHRQRERDAGRRRTADACWPPTTRPIPSSCTNYYGVRINPSNTGNVRIQSLWHLGDKLRLTFDPSYQYVLANGGGTTTIAETPIPPRPTSACAATPARRAST